jgi:hypothetical protein
VARKLTVLEELADDASDEALKLRQEPEELRGCDRRAAAPEKPEPVEIKADRQAGPTDQGFKEEELSPVTWAGSPFAQLIEFRTGLPTGAISYTLIGNAGEVLVDDQRRPGSWRDQPPPGDRRRSQRLRSAALRDPHPRLTPTSPRRASCPTASSTASTSRSRSPHREQGVRIEARHREHELTDDEVDLVSAYGQLLTFGDPTSVRGQRRPQHAPHGPRDRGNRCALVVGTLQLKIAQREDSGTNKFIRFRGPRLAPHRERPAHPYRPRPSAPRRHLRRDRRHLPGVRQDHPDP